jgi:Domain of unknown function (DUF4395)
MGHRGYRLRVRRSRADGAVVESARPAHDPGRHAPLPLAARPVAGPPKRFAQGIGVAFSVSALILTILGFWTAAQVVLGLLATAAFLESALGLCLGCKAFAVLMRFGVVPEEVCEKCNNIWARTAPA